MKNKKYNTSMSILYEGLTFDLGSVYYQNPQGRNCRINVPDNVREFLFAVGRYSNKDSAGEEVPAHTGVAGYLSSKLPANIFSAIEKGLANKENFDAIMSGPVADFSNLMLTQVDCNLIQLGLNKLSLFLSKTSSYKANIEQARQDVINSEQQLRQNQDGNTIATSLFGAGVGAGVAATTKGAENPTIQTLVLSLQEEELRKINEISRELRVDTLRFNNLFRAFNDSRTGNIDTGALFFRNFVKEYYDTQKWDENKLQEDIDEITSLARRCQRISDRSSLVDIYQDYMRTIGATPTPLVGRILSEYDKTTDQQGRSYFKQKLGLMIFHADPNAFFYGKQYAILAGNSNLRNREYAGTKINNLFAAYGEEISKIFN